MSFTSIRDKYIKDATHIKEQPANILDQLPSYNSYETNVFIDTLNVEYQEQLSLNKLLKDENIEQQSQKVKDFVKDNNDKINSELLALEEITTDLKNYAMKIRN
jgi:gas vesicle protein